MDASYINHHFVFDLLAICMAISAAMYKFFPDNLDVGVDIEEIGNEPGTAHTEQGKEKKPTSASMSRHIPLEDVDHQEMEEDGEDIDQGELDVSFGLTNDTANQTEK